MIADRIIALRVSNYETIGQRDLFVSYIPSFRQLTCLRSLTIVKLRSYKVFIELLNKCRQLDSHTCLNVNHCHFRIEKADFSLIIDKIWSLLKLTDCHFYNIFTRPYYFRVPTIISTSIECVTIFHSELSSDRINQLFKYTPRLKRLSMQVMNLSENNDKISPHSKLIQLYMYFIYPTNVSRILDFLKSMPNLRHLKINLRHHLIDDHQWERTIRNYLSKLKTFRLKMRWFPHDQQIIDGQESIDMM